MALGNLQDEGDLQRFIEAQQRPMPSSPTRGQATVTFPGGSAYSNIVTVNHRLVRAPTAVLASARTSAATGGAAMSASVVENSITATTFQVTATASGTPPAAATTTVDWAAFP